MLKYVALAEEARLPDRRPRQDYGHPADLDAAAKDALAKTLRENFLANELPKLARAAPMRAAIRLLSGERPVNSFPKTAANYRELTPLSYVERAAVVFDDSPAVVDGDATRTWAETFARCCGLGDALRREGCGRGDVVQVMLDNTAEMVEAQHGVPMSGATLGCVNNGSTRRPSPTRAKWAALTDAAAAEKRSRQGVAHAATGGVDVLDRDTGAPVPADGRPWARSASGNIVMKGYLKDAAATAAAFRLGAFASGDLAVKHADGYVQIKDRSKDIIISGRNISTVEIEAALMEHDDVEECAVVARPDAHWGETPCAFVETRAGATLDEASLWPSPRAPRGLQGAEVPRRDDEGVVRRDARGEGRVDRAGSAAASRGDRGASRSAARSAQRRGALERRGARGLGRGHGGVVGGDARGGGLGQGRDRRAHGPRVLEGDGAVLGARVERGLEARGDELRVAAAPRGEGGAAARSSAL
ncbi:ligase [Aureococcus anophagefferens]|nr:ligase [Aureococcus anophagefferens]